MIGLPKFDLQFENQAKTFLERNKNGIVCMIVVDSILDKSKLHYFDDINIKTDTMDEKTLDYIKLIFAGGAKGVMVLSVADLTDEDLYLKLKTTRFNYLVIPELPKLEHKKAVDFITQHRNIYKPSKLILQKYEGGGQKYILNWATSNIITSNGKTWDDYTARIAGLAAKASVDAAVTYNVLKEVEAADLTDDPDTAVNEGKLILIHDGEKFKIARGVTTSEEENEELKKLAIVEAADLIYQDIKDNWDNNFVGKIKNSYSKKITFLSKIREYFSDLEKKGILQKDANTVEISIEGNKAYLEKKGIDTSLMELQQIKEANTGSLLCVVGKIRILDAMEDISLKFNS